jgi:hypothetical protein
MRHLIAALVSIAFVAGLVAQPTAPLRLTLAQSDIGKLPTGWLAAKTGDAEGSVWKVVEDATAPSKSGLALAQTAKGPSPLYNLCVAVRSQFGRNVKLKVSLRAIDGEIDQGGGVVWLYKDAKNYYITRYNPLEDNFRLYYVKDGKRIQLATKEDLKLEGKAWHTIDVTHKGDAITCMLDGKFRLEVKDSTFTEPGQVGLWTKADAKTHFDGFEAREAKK